MKKFLEKIHIFIKRVVGTENLRYQVDYQQQLLNEIRSLLKYSVIDNEKVMSSITYKRCKEVVSLISPMDVNESKYVRVGGKYDGGYVMLDIFKFKPIRLAYSFGIGKDVSWDESIAKRGIDVFMFDHTIDRLPKKHPNFHFEKIGVTGFRKKDNLKTLREIINKFNHNNERDLIMKMDIEGSEWDVFDETSSKILENFSQIVIEFHGLCSILDDQKYNLITNVLKKINTTHQSIHVHANTNCIPLWIDNIILPNIMEVTFIRRSDVHENFINNTRNFPTKIDMPTFKGLPDLDLGKFGDI